MGAYVVVGDDVVIGEDAVLLPHVVIYPGARIGKRFFAHAHAIVREGCVLGDDVTLQNGAVIGADGFGFAKNADGSWTKILQTGPAVLEDAVEVQANACVDRASVGETRIAKGAKIDNLVQVGHGSTVGENSLLCAQVGLAGSTTVGKNVILAGQVGVAGHLTIGDGAVATAQTGIPSDVAAGAVVSGYPAMDNKMWLRTVAAVNRLPELIRKLRANGMQGEIVLRFVRGLGLTAVVLVAGAWVGGCKSPYVNTTVKNDTGAAVTLIEVDYPSASFGRESLAAGAVYPYGLRCLAAERRRCRGRTRRGRTTRPQDRTCMKGNRVSWRSR